jgi:hypothetical protein
MPQQLVDRGPPDLAWAASRWSGVIHDPVRAGRLEAAAAQIDHGVKGQVLLELPIEQQVACLRAPDGAGYEIGIEPLQRARVGELGEGAVRQIGIGERTGPHAEQRGSQRRARIRELLDRGGVGDGIQIKVRRPGAVVLAQRFAIGEPNQRRAVVDLVGQAGRLPVVLALGQKREPVAESAAVLFVVEPQEPGRAVGEVVAQVGCWILDFGCWFPSALRPTSNIQNPTSAYSDQDDCSPHLHILLM